ncbi:hypothetical protein MSG28_010555 [Choristoneura fumiferana]|uniref:Uncharacterized protein n=1 Tax=Choristoneura fumiferana TaxID=7141 RepID=A0ACC0KNM0_CHOFU|nr:hypothetical protein MSG28_010555 [Choristoneura fumiferana]
MVMVMIVVLIMMIGDDDAKEIGFLFFAPNERKNGQAEQSRRETTDYKNRETSKHKLYNTALQYFDNTLCVKSRRQTCSVVHMQKRNWKTDSFLPVKQCEAIRPLNRHPQLARIDKTAEEMLHYIYQVQ